MPPSPPPRLVGVAAPASTSRPPHGGLLQAPPLPAAAAAAAASPLSPSTLACRCRRSSWFSNAEQGDNDAGSRRRKWWPDAERDSDYDFVDEEQDEYEYEYEYGGGGGVFDEPWFSKVFRTYGYVLPVVLVSMLFATGLKPFLMAMAIPLGQSAVSFVLNSFRGTGRRRNNRGTAFEEYEYDDNDYKAQGNWGEDKTYSYYDRTKKSSYKQSSESDGGNHNTNNSNTADQGGATSTKSGFGGWDELDSDNFKSKRPPRPPPRTTTVDGVALRRGGGSRQRMSTRRMGNSLKCRNSQRTEHLRNLLYPLRPLKIRERTKKEMPIQLLNGRCTQRKKVQFHILRFYGYPRLGV